MKKVTSVTTFKTDLGTMLALTYSVVADDGTITKRNAKLSKVVVDDDANELITKLTAFAQKIVDAQE